MKNMFFLFTALLGLSLTTAVKADLFVADDFYASFLAGPNWVNNSSHHWSEDFNNGRNHHHTSIDFDTGYVVGANAGYTWCNNFSAEVEFTYRHNSVDKVKFKHTHKKHEAKETVVAKDNDHKKDKKKHHSSGNLRSYAIMANARYDLPIDCCFTPYFKVGIGYANSKLHHNKENNHHDNKAVVVAKGDNNKEHKKSNHNNHSENGFAWQVGAGISYPVCDNLALDIGYNFLRTQRDINNNSLIFAAKYGF